MILLQSQIIERSLEVSPYNAAAFGVLVAVLLVAVGVLWVRDGNHIKAKDEIVKAHSEDVKGMITLITKVEIRLTEDMQLKKDVQEMLVYLKSKGNEPPN